MPLPTRTLGKTKLAVSPLGFGSAVAAFTNAEANAAAKLVNALLDAGVNVIDTAAAYPGSHAFIGQYLAHRRDDYVLVTKCGNRRPDGTSPPMWSAALVAANVDDALRDLKTDAIDVMLLHSCDLETLRKGDAFGALVAARDAGKVKFIGYSGDNEAVAHACAMPEVSVVETSVNYVDQANVEQALPVARTNDVGVIAKRPVANAAWLGPTGRPGFYDKYASEYVRRQSEMKPAIEDYGFDAADWPEFALRFTLSFPEVSTAIVGTQNPANALKNLEYVAKGPLPGDVVERVRASFRATPGSAGWTGQT